MLTRSSPPRRMYMSSTAGGARTWANLACSSQTCCLCSSNKKKKKETSQTHTNERRPAHRRTTEGVTPQLTCHPPQAEEPRKTSAPPCFGHLRLGNGSFVNTVPLDHGLHKEKQGPRNIGTQLRTALGAGIRYRVGQVQHHCCHPEKVLPAQAPKPQP